MHKGFACCVLGLCKRHAISTKIIHTCVPHLVGEKE